MIKSNAPMAAAVISIGVLCAASLPAAAQTRPAPAAAPPVSGPAANLFENASLAPMIDKVVPAVVSIRVKGLEAIEQNPLYNHPLFNRMVEKMTEPEKRAFQSSGSGVVIDAVRGLVLTNYHVIEKGKEIKVRTHDGHEYDGVLIGQDPATDIALVRIEAKGLAGIAIGDSMSVRVGDLVVAIGNPFALDATATLGMVSSLRRSAVGFRDFEAYIQHDAAVNSGNSGGALVNMRGQLIGINTAILSPSGGSVGLGFAIPIGLAERILDQLVKYGHVRRGWNGIRVEDVTSEKARQHGLASLRGAMISQIAKGSPAEKAGAQTGDVITEVRFADGRSVEIENAAHFRTGEGITEVGMKLTMTIVRHGVSVQVPVVMADFKREPETREAPSDNFRLAGVVVQSLEDDSPLFGEVRGVQIMQVKPGTYAQAVGLLAGDVITKVDDRPVRSPEEFLKNVKDKKEKFEMHVVRGGVPVLVKFPL